jgi:hypothetical protein
VDIYDASTGTWTIAELSEPKVNVPASVIGTKAIFGKGALPAGGRPPIQQLPVFVDIYDAETNQWTNVTSPLQYTGCATSIV